MKRIFSLLVVVTMLYSLCVPAFAVEDDGDLDSSVETEFVSETVSTEIVPDDKSVIVNVVMPAAVEETPLEDDLSSGDLMDFENNEESITVSSYSTYSLDDMESPVESSIPAVLTSLFGEYQPRTQTVTEYLSDGSSVSYTQVVSGLAGLDWLWLASVALFAMALYCVLRAIGGCLKWI